MILRIQQQARVVFKVSYKCLQFVWARAETNVSVKLVFPGCPFRLFRIQVPGEPLGEADRTTGLIRSAAQ